MLSTKVFLVSCIHCSIIHESWYTSAYIMQWAAQRWKLMANDSICIEINSLLLANIYFKCFVLYMYTSIYCT